jgi:hypothetical protein
MFSRGCSPLSRRTLTDWLVPEPGARRIAGAAWEPAALDARVRPLLLERVRRELDPFPARDAAAVRGRLGMNKCRLTSLIRLSSGA